MKYDPIKKSLGNVFNKTPFLRIIFYRLLDLLLLRAWYIKHELKKWYKSVGNEAFILDAGSGFGQYSYRMAKTGANWKILGIDVKTEQIADCNEFFNKISAGNRVEFKEADLTAFSREATFDLILSVDVMEHIEDDIQVFKNFNASLKKGGMLLISTPSDKGGSDVHSEDDHSFIDEHVRDGYNINDIRNKLTSAGFERIETKYSYGSFGQISWTLSMKYPILMLNFSKIMFLILPFYYALTFPISFILNVLDLNLSHKTGTGLIVKAWK